MEFHDFDDGTGSHRHDQCGKRANDLGGDLKRDGECQQRKHHGDLPIRPDHGLWEHGDRGSEPGNGEY